MSDAMMNEEQLNANIKATVEPLLQEARRIGQIGALAAIQEKMKSGTAGAQLESYITSQIEKHLSEGGDVTRSWVKDHLPNVKTK